MPHERFFSPEELHSGSSLFLVDKEHHHLAHVLRLKLGEEVELVNGRGALARACVTAISKKETHLKVVSSHITPFTPPLLAVGIPFMRLAKLEWIVEKGTELGADLFCFYRADFSEKSDLSTHQMERLRALSLAALKQSGRLYLPTFEVLPFSALCTRFKILFHGDVHEDAPLFAPPPDLSSLAFITGPEKGFSKEERSLLEKKSKGVRLGPYILRAETAPIAALSILGRMKISF